jgi:SPP1 gp7 family putative phage head morphogenesis protein
VSASDGEILEWIYFAKRLEVRKGIVNDVQDFAKKHAFLIKAVLLATIAQLALAVHRAKEAGANADLGSIVSQSMAMDAKPLAQALQNIYAEGGEKGVDFGLQLLGPLATASALIEADALETLDAGASEIAGGINQTTMDLITRGIEQGVLNGADVDQIVSDLKDRVVGDARVSEIANTESNRAYNAGMVDAFQRNGITQFNWILSDTACPICQAQAGVHDITDDVPPAHPDCLCTIEPIPNTDVELDNGQS